MIATDLTKQGGVQDEIEAESGAEATGGGDDGSNADSQESSTQGQEGNTSEGSLLEDGNLSPELEETRKQLMADYHSKTQKLAEEKRQLESQMSGFQEKAGMLDKLLGQDWFVKALESRRGGQQEPGLSQEELERAGIGQEQMSAFEKIIQARMKSELQKLEPTLKAHNAEIREMKLEKERGVFRKVYPDFAQVEKSEAYQKLEAQHGPKTAYALARLEVSPQSSTQEAERILAARKAASVAKGGPTKVDGKKVFKSRNFRETLGILKDVIESGGSADSVEIDTARD